jgi:hypoxanthine phosphoribosyltransferase
MADLHVSWDQYHADIERLAAQVHASGWTFNQVICLARGGLRVGDMLSRIFRQPLAILSTQSYSGEAGTVRGQITVAEHMTMTTPALGDRVLLVDDLVDSGVTLGVVRDALAARYPQIWEKACSAFKPDYAARFLPDDPWIHQPFEPYDVMDPASLSGRLDS